MRVYKKHMSMSEYQADQLDRIQRRLGRLIIDEDEAREECRAVGLDPRAYDHVLEPVN